MYDLDLFDPHIEHKLMKFINNIYMNESQTNQTAIISS